LGRIGKPVAVDPGFEEGVSALCLQWRFPGADISGATGSFRITSPENNRTALFGLIFASDSSCSTEEFTSPLPVIHSSSEPLAGLGDVRYSLNS
jgi:hypothetical protein